MATALRELESPPNKPMPPFPDFVPQPWAGGPEPEPVHAPVVTSHGLEEVVMSRSYPFRFERVVGFLGWPAWVQNYDSSPDSGWSQTVFVGKGLGGSESCSWGIDLLSWYGMHPWSDCNYSNALTSWRIADYPSELKAYADAPVGTKVSFTILTYKANLDVHSVKNGEDKAPDFYFNLRNFITTNGGMLTILLMSFARLRNFYGSRLM